MIMLLFFSSLVALSGLSAAAPAATGSKAKPIVDTPSDNGLKFELIGTIKGQRFRMDPLNTQFFFNELPNVYCVKTRFCSAQDYRTAVFNFERSDGSMTLNARAPFLQIVYVDPTGALRYFVDHEGFYNAGSSFKSWEVFEPAAASALILNYFKDGKHGTEMPFCACSLHAGGDFRPGPGYQIFVAEPKGFSRSGCIEFTPSIKFSTVSHYAWGK